MSENGAFDAMTRIGFTARGVMYVLIGWLALRSGRTENGEGILDYLDSGGGRLVLAGMAIGFFAYGAWRLLDAWTDGERHGRDAKGLAVRAGGIVSGLAHLGLGAAAALHVAGSGGGGGGSGAAKDGAATALSLPGGGLVLVLVAAALLATAAVQALKAWNLYFLRHLDSGGNRRWLAWLGRAGYAARGMVFAIMAVLFWRAATEERSSAAGGIGEALGSLPSALQGALAAGLLLFGLFSFAEARFRRLDTRIS